MIIVHALSTTLAERGHNVTILSAFGFDKKIPNHREVLMPFDKETLTKFTQKAFENPNQSILKSLPWIVNKALNLGLDLVKLPEFQKILEEKFDLVIIGMFFNNFLLGYGDHFKCPTVMLTTTSHISFTNSLTGNSAENNAVPSIHLKPSVLFRMTFFERVKNVLINSVENLMNAYMNYRQKIVYE
jgi:glucuronosyltransferase